MPVTSRGGGEDWGATFFPSSCLWVVAERKGNWGPGPCMGAEADCEGYCDVKTRVQQLACPGEFNRFPYAFLPGWMLVVSILGGWHPQHLASRYLKRLVKILNKNEFPCLLV